MVIGRVFCLGDQGSNPSSKMLVFNISKHCFIKSIVTSCFFKQWVCVICSFKNKLAHIYILIEILKALTISRKRWVLYGFSSPHSYWFGDSRQHDLFLREGAGVLLRQLASKQHEYLNPWLKQRLPRSLPTKYSPWPILLFLNSPCQESTGSLGCR